MRPLHTAVFSLPMWAGTVKETWFQVYEKVHFLSVPEMVSPSFKFSLVLLMQTDQCTTGGNFACSKDILDIQILYVFEDWILNDKG